MKRAAIAVSIMVMLMALSVSARYLNGVKENSDTDQTARIVVLEAAVLAGGTMPATDGGAITNLSAANIADGTVASAFDGNAITNLNVSFTNCFLLNAYNIATSSNRLGIITDASDVKAADFANRALSDTAGSDSIDWANRVMKDSSGNNTIDYENGELGWPAGTTASVDWQNRYLVDSSGNATVLYDTRALTGGAWVIADDLTVNGGQIEVTGDGTSTSLGVNTGSGETAYLKPRSLDISTGNGFTVQLQSSGIYFDHALDITAGNIMTIRSNGDQLTDSNGRQAGLFVNPEVQQSGTAAIDAMYVDLDITSLGDGSTGGGNNLLNLSTNGISKFKVDLNGDAYGNAFYVRDSGLTNRVFISTTSNDGRIYGKDDEENIRWFFRADGHGYTWDTYSVGTNSTAYQFEVAGGSRLNGNVNIDGVLTMTDAILSDSAIETTGNISGKTPVTLDTDAAVTLVASNCYGKVRINSDDDVIDYTLPSAEAGLTITFANHLYARVITVDAAAGDKIILNDGTALDAGDAIDSSGAADDKGTLVAIDDEYWILFSEQNTWVDGGAD